MRILLIVFLAFLCSCLFNPVAFADTCSDYKQKTGLDLNEAECYVLEQVENGKIAHFKVSDEWNAEFEASFTKIEDRTLGAVFLKMLLTGSLSKVKVPDEGVRISNARIEEPLYLKNTMVPFTVSLSFCIFDRGADFSATTFSGEASFAKAIFSESASFYRATFSEKASFVRVTFSKNASFERATFSGSSYFVEAIFSKRASIRKTASFRRANFFGKASFGGAIFSGEALFTETEFSEGASFRRANFFGKASFNGATFSGTTSFGGAIFSEEASFGVDLFGMISSGATFTGDASFDRATFSGDASFNGATFSGTAYFSEVTFLEEADFSSCDFTSKSNFKRALFHDTVIFDDVSGFSKMVVEWKYGPEKFGYEKNIVMIKLRELKNHLKYNETFYIALIKNYRDMGWFTEADDCYYTYRVEKWKHRLEKLNEPNQNRGSNPTSFSRWWTKARLKGEWILLDLTFGYGVRPDKIFKTFLAFWIPFSFYYLGFVRSKYGQKLNWWQAWNPFYKPSRLLWSLVYSLDTFTPGLNFDPFAIIKSKVFIKRNTRWVVYPRRIQQILGWYWAALFLILFSKIWIR